MVDFTKMMDKILEMAGLSPAAKLLYAVVASLCRDRGYCWATNEELGKRICLSGRTVSRLLRELRHKGLVACDMDSPQTMGLNARRLVRLTGQEQTDHEALCGHDEDTSFALQESQPQPSLPEQPRVTACAPVPGQAGQDLCAFVPEQAEAPELREKKAISADSAVVRTAEHPAQQEREDSGVNQQPAAPSTPATQTDQVLEKWISVRHRDWDEGEKMQFARFWRSYWVGWVKQGHTLPDRAERYDFLEKLHRISGGDRETLLTILQQKRAQMASQ